MAKGGMAMSPIGAALGSAFSGMSGQPNQLGGKPVGQRIAGLKARRGMPNAGNSLGGGMASPEGMDTGASPNLIAELISKMGIGSANGGADMKTPMMQDPNRFRTMMSR